MSVSITMLAPCGLNCLVCYARLRKKNPARDAGKRKTASLPVAAGAPSAIAPQP